MARPNRRLTKAARYSKYVDGPDPLAAPVDLSDALDAIGESVFEGSSAEQAMREYLRRGGRDGVGLDDLARRVAERRRDLTRDHDLSGTLSEVRRLLDAAILAERGQLARDVEMDEGERALAQMQMDAVPTSPAAAVSELNGYDWRSADARQSFDRIKDLLGREMLDQRFAGMKRALQNATDSDRAAVTRMLADLAELLEAHRLGVDTPQQFDDFMEKHGEHFPEHPGSVDELVDALANRAAAAQRMRNSMTPEQRRELDELATEAFGSPELMSALGRLDESLRSLRPQEDWGGAESMNGENGVGLGDGTGVFQDIAELDALAEQLSQSYAGSSIDDLDLDALGRQLGDTATVDARALQRLEKALRESGTVRRGIDGRLRLSPRAMRQLGRKLLRDVTKTLSGRAGGRETRLSGARGERSGASREWAFGDTEPWDVTRTITNAVTRTAAEWGGRRSQERIARVRIEGVRIELGDVEVQETEDRTQACVALLVDTSFSMAMDGRWVPMKRTALALHTLVSTRFRGDELQLIGFGRAAEVMDIERLVALDAQWEKGTNLHHALLLANRHFRKHPSAQPVLLIVTDGEPTSHLEPDGEVFFDYPPAPQTIMHAVRELDASMRLGARTTFFRLGDDPGLARFVDSMAKRVGGAVIAPEADDLGAAVVGSFLDAREGRGEGPRDRGAGTL